MTGEGRMPGCVCAFLGVLCASLAWIAGAAGAGAPDSRFVELDETVDGMSLSHYANDWWQWTQSMPSSPNPVADTTGAHCAVGQSGPVWYLAGGYGTSLIERRCTVPVDRHLFFPVINMLVFTPPGQSQTCASAKAQAARNNDRFVYVRVFLDGERLEGAERFRIASSDCFDLRARAPLEGHQPRYYPSATDGYWIMLRPLPPGRHRLEFRAFYTNQGNAFGDMVQNIAYDLVVGPGD